MYGRLASSDEGGKFSGKSELQLERRDWLSTGVTIRWSAVITMCGKSRGAVSAKKVNGGARWAQLSAELPLAAKARQSARRRAGAPVLEYRY